jgi:carboxyl-terminal processing protease
MTGLFIDEGPVVQVRDSQGRVNLERDREPGMAWDGPLAVLVDRRSASASEIFAAAIQDYGRGVVIGETTFGKGTVQNLIDLDEFSRSENSRLGQIKLTMAQFYRIAGGSTQLKGVVPDISCPARAIRRISARARWSSRCPGARSSRPNSRRWPTCRA